MSAHAVTLRSAVFPRHRLLVDALLVLGGALVVAGAAQISFHIPGTPVPVTGHTFGVVLVGASLGAAAGAASLALYLLLGLAFPFYASGASGWEALTGPSGGYIIGFVVAAALVGHLSERGWDIKVSSSVAAMLTGNVVIYLFGLPWLATHALAGTTASFGQTMSWGLYPFVPGDLAKLYLAGASMPLAWELVTKLRRSPPVR